MEVCFHERERERELVWFLRGGLRVHERVDLVR